ncbi:MAG: DNA metabolism protein [Lachnospiraceae bacterium]|nr:DNA metabolism protein [Lachnospiraceae bacterium]
MKGFLCEDSLEGIFTGIYDAWDSGLGHENVRLFMKEQYEPEFFWEYEEVAPDAEKSEKVARSIRKKISGEAFRVVYRAALSAREERADVIYRFLIEGFCYGGITLRLLQKKAVADIFALSRKVANEAHQYLEFIRFEQLKNGVLFSVISPRSRVITLVAPHFADRFPEENWVIYDDVREEAAIHMAGEEWVVAEFSKAEADAFLEAQGEADGYVDLWKVFFRTISIKERENPNCQRNFLPLWYRKHMTEFL